jgi:hypothetical protein
LAQFVIGEQLKGLGRGEADLSQQPKSDPAKLALAARLRRETTLMLTLPTTVAAGSAQRHG